MKIPLRKSFINSFAGFSDYRVVVKIEQAKRKYT